MTTVEDLEAAAWAEGTGMPRTDYWLKQRQWVSDGLEWVLRHLEGADRIQALQACREAGIGATELAQLAGFSRARLYQLLEKGSK